MRVLEVLSKVVCSEELFGLIAFAKFVYTREMFNSAIPVGRRMVWEFLTTEATDICYRTVRPLGIRRTRGVEDCLIAGDGRTGPRVSPQMERVLVSFGFVLILEAVVAV
jgi:hypothetical protein